MATVFSMTECNALTNSVVKGQNIVKTNRTVERKINSFLPTAPVCPGAMVEDKLLHDQQSELSVILETATTPIQARRLLDASGLADTAWEVEKWEDSMLETAISIAQKWKNGFN